MTRNQENTRIDKVLPENADSAVATLYQRSEQVMGMVPNLFHHLAMSPQILHGFLELQIALESGVLDAEARESIALRVGESNRAGYCVAMHHYVGQSVAGLDKTTINMARKGVSNNSKIQAILDLTGEIMDKNGLVSSDEIANAKKAGITDAELIEVIANIAWNQWANYVDGLAEPIADTPPVELFD